MFKNYLITTWRNLTRNKIYSVINIIGLSLGLACAMLIILYTSDELSYDRFHANADRIYRIVHNRMNADGSIDSRGGNSGALQGPVFSTAIPEIASFVRFNGGQQELKQGTAVVIKQVHVTDPGFFITFSFPLLQGNPAMALKDPHSVVLSVRAAEEQFGTRNAMGKTLYLKNGDQFEPYTVTGIARNTPQNSSIQFDILLPLKIDAADENWGNYFLNTFVVLKPAANVLQVEATMKKVYESAAGVSTKKPGAGKMDQQSIVHLLQPFTAIHLSQEYKAKNGLSDASDPIYSYILSGIALFILLIACINFVNLTVARSVRRAKEIGIRKVIGSSRKQLIFQFLGESFALCLGAFLLALIIVQATLPTFNQLANKELELSYLFTWNLAAGYIALYLVTGLLAGAYPALVLSNYDPVQTLYNRFMLAGKSYLQKGLVVLQFTLATLLVVATITIYEQFNYLTHKELGYDDSNVIMIEKWGMKYEEAKVLKEQLMKDRNIISVAAKNGGRRGTFAKINGETEIGFDHETIDESYLPLYKVPLVAGRNFSADHPSDSTQAVLVNEQFVKQAGWSQPIGQQVNFWHKKETYTVIGVVKNHHYQPLTSEVGPQLFSIRPTINYGLILVKIKPNTAAASLQSIQKSFMQLFPASSFVYKFKELENQKNYEAEAKWKQMMLFGAVVTIFISCIGLFGLSVLAAEKRRKEIGIRKVLGASAARLVTALTVDFLKLVMLALLIALPVAWLLINQWLQHYPYRISLSWSIFTATILLISMIALSTVSFQAIRTALANPVKSLRTE